MTKTTRTRTTRTRTRKTAVQDTPTLPFHRNGKRGGYRPGAGRKPLPPNKRRSVPHRCRAKLSKHHPVHVTVRLRNELPPLRNKRTLAALQRCFAAGRDRFGFRLVHYSVQSSHLHLICEADDRQAFSRGMKGLLVRVAKALNRLWSRRGPVFRDRYHEEILTSPRRVRNALAYVLNNLWRHLRSVSRSPRAGVTGGLDGFASGLWFDGWQNKPKVALVQGVDPPVCESRTWLIKSGWRRHGLIRLGEVPRGS